MLFRSIWTGRSAVEANVENERFTVVRSRCRYGNFTLSLDSLRQRIVLICLSHEQHDDLSSFNQSDHCFLASSLPSSLLKLSIEFEMMTSMANFIKSFIIRN